MNIRKEEYYQNKVFNFLSGYGREQLFKNLDYWATHTGHKNAIKQAQEIKDDKKLVEFLVDNVFSRTVSYVELSEKTQMVLCNHVNNDNECWFPEELENGYFEDAPEDWDEESNGEYDPYNIGEIYQSFLVNPSGAEYLKDHTDELVQYHEKLDVYVWHIQHFGTPWNGVHTTLYENIYWLDGIKN